MSELFIYESSPAAWVRVTGEDAADFLQSQFSNDLRSTHETPVTYGLWLDRKGKVHGDSFILRTGEEEYFLYSYATPAETIIEKLDAFIIADDVELTDETGNVTAFSFWGENPGKLLSAVGLEAPEENTFTRHESAWVIPGRRTSAANCDVILNKEHLQAFRKNLEAHTQGHPITWATPQDAELTRIRACIPLIPRDIGPDDLPQEGALDRDAVSFNKGCYLGQEVMARLHSMGRAQRSLHPVELPAASLPKLPCALFHDDRNIGELRTAVTQDDNATGLAILKNRALAEAKAFALEPGGPALVRLSGD